MTSVLCLERTPCGQVKHVMSQQDEGQSSHGGGPLAEIRFWHSRGEDLANVLAQLDLPGHHTHQHA